MEVKIAVCDDEQSVVAKIDTYLDQIQKDLGVTFRVFYFSSGEELLQDMPRDVRILLLDIQMGGISGLEAAKQLRREGADFYLFFITSNVQYALEGYEVHAYAFLQKPPQYVQLKAQLKNVLRKIRNEPSDLLRLKTKNAVHVIDCKKLLYAEVYGHSTYLVFEDRDRLSFNMSLDTLEESLRSHGFFRCHKSYLVNLQKVSSINGNDVKVTNGDIIPLSKHRKNEFLLSLQDLMRA